MNTLHRYLLRQMISTLVMTVIVFAFVLLLGNLLRQIVSLLVNHQVTLFTILEAIAYLVPYVLVYALPMGLLTATLLTFGRFSADQELTAVRAGGISLLSLATPVLLLAVVISGFSAAISLDVAPRCHGAYRELLYRVGVQGAMALIPEKWPIRDFKDVIFYVGEVKGDTLNDIKAVHLDRTGTADLYVRADSGRLVSSTNRELTLILFNAQFTAQENGVLRPGSATAEWQQPLIRDSDTQRVLKKRVSDMTFWELQEEMRNLQERLRAPVPPQTLTSDELRQQQRDWEKQRNGLLSPILTEIHANVSFAFSCFSFTLVGIPLAIRAHRRETSVGVAVALIVALIFHGFVGVGEALSSRPEFYPHLLVWVPNLLFQALGCVMLWRANRGI
jgi:lipopolysaccharide export system permease protein